LTTKIAIFQTRQLEVRRSRLRRGLSYLVSGCLAIPRSQIGLVPRFFIFRIYRFKIGTKKWRPETTLKNGAYPEKPYE